MDQPARPLLTICELGRIGDIVASEPLYRHLRKTYPDRWIRWYTRPAFVELLAYSPAIDEVVTVSGPEDYLRHKKALPPETISFEFNFRSAEEVVNGGRDKKPMSLLNQFAIAAGLPVFDETPVFPFRPDGVPTPPLPPRYFVFHCASQGKSRQWPRAKWSTLARHFFSRGESVVEIGLAPQIQSDNPLYTNLTGKRGFQELAAVIGNSAGFIGVDSGFSHIANATGVFGMIITGRLRNQPDFNPFSGQYRNGARVNMVRLYDELAVRVPADLAEKVADRLIDGNPMTGSECDLFCLTEQIRRQRRNPFFRLVHATNNSLAEIQSAWIYHRVKHAAPRPLPASGSESSPTVRKCEK